MANYVISGTVFNDYDSNGINDGTSRGVGFASESGVEGIAIAAYDDTETLVGTAITGSDGTYSLDINTPDPVRIEFILPSGYVSTSLAGVANNTVSDIAFASSATTMDLGIHRAHEVTSGDGSNIDLITVCYVAGVGGTGDSAIVIHGYNDYDDQAQNAYTPKADIQEIGTVNGLAYHRESETLFAGSFYKRHSALLGTIDYTNDNDASAATNDASGAAYTSIIYTIDNSNANETGNVSIFARLDDVVDPRGAIDSDNFGGGSYNWDTDSGSDSNSSTEVFDAVGKYGLGDLELSPDGTTLWVVNLNDKKLYQLPVGDSSDPLTPSTPATADIESFDLITNIISSGDDLGINPQQNIRPFALSIRDGLVYVGMVNTAQYDENGAEGNTTAADLQAFVYTFDPDNPTATPVQVLDIPLNYERDQVIREGNSIVLGNWNPWVSTWPDPDTFYTGGSDEVAYPQAILSDIDFDPDGNMILGFRDRWGDQLGNDTNAPDTATNGTELYEADAGGDILQAIYDANTGTWSIETHVTTDGINGNNDPDGEFFRNDFFEDGAANDSLQIHAETAQGGLTVVPGFTEVVTTAYDPIDAFTGGFEWFDTTDGGFAGHFNGNGESGLEIYTGLLGKANGLGDIEFIADASDIEIGNRIWDDTNKDGIQNADETNFDSNNAIAVELYDSNGNLIDSTTTTDGEYYFSGLSPFTDYEVRLAASNFTSGQVLEGYLTTLQNANSDGSDQIDSDASNDGGVPSISFTTGASGTNDYSFDFGLTNNSTTDYGDAPDTTSGTGEGDYQTTAANTGASHTIVNGITIGSEVTADDGTLQNSEATADSDDGVTFTSTLQTTDTSFSVDVEVNVTGSTTLVGWIDFDQSGSFDSDEAVSTTVSSSGTETLTWNAFPGIIDGATYARFRLSTDGNLDTSYATGAASDGEVEDYQITVGLDYGDAPDTTAGTGTGDYQTTSVNTGASHGIINGLHIGSIVDADNGTLENADADNDDTDGSDDEDGVTFSTNLALSDTSYSVDVEIENTTGNDAMLTGWIDFDQSGTFDADEDASVVVSSSGSQTLTWNVLPGLVAGTTYARFRLSSDFTAAGTSTIYAEDFEGITDWRTDGSLNIGNTATAGDWAIGNPTVSEVGGTTMQPEDANSGTNALISDLSTADIDAGSITSRSDTFTLDSGSGNHSITFSYFLSSFTSNVSDEITVDLVNSANTSDRANLLTDTVASGATQAAVWTEITSAIDSSFNGKTVYLEFTAQDGGGDDTVEAGIDDITVTYTTEATPLDATGALDDGEVEDYQINIGIDYGDAPDTSSSTGTGDYQTTADNGGASHTIDSNLSLGSNLDADDGTLQNSDATADDLDNTDDEDGVTFTSNLELDDSSYSVTVDINNDTGSTATLIGWIDFDQSGTFDSDEATSATFAADATGQTLTWSTIPGDVTYGTTYARFRLSTDSDLDNNYANGALTDGEVEDYKLTVGLDYGDARDTGTGTATGDYSTTANDNGASHIIDPDLSLGSNVDADDGTLQNTGATADDDALNDGATDDEDGVTFPNTIRTDSSSYSVTVDINNDTGNTATLIGWIDFDQSGTFDSDEATSATFTADATSQTLTWSSIPEDITDGDTYVRFRLSTDSNLDADYSTGQLSDGEVEDYEINIVGIDYGDAPDTVSGASTGDYDTTLADGGASHTITQGLKLGATVDAENGTLQNTAADADDLDNNNDDDDEDGITFNSTLDLSTSSFSVDIDYTNNTGGNAEIIGWIDFDQSGTFDSDEAVSSGTLGTSVFDQSTTLTWNSLPGIVSGTTYARFRLNDNITNLTTSTPTGELDGGEVEDYQILIEGGTDYGDAPDTTAGTGIGDYQTSSANNGPSHSIISGLNLGSIVDAENDGQNSTGADGDDTNDTDDEDGVTFDSNLKTTDTEYSVTVDVINTTGTDAILAGWIDFDRDGSFESGESTSITVSSSGTQTLTWSSLPGITAGTTYARFRLGTSNSTTTIYSEDFEGITDWRTDGSLNIGNTATAGDWAIGNPTVNTVNGTTMQPEDASSGTNALISDLSTTDIDAGSITSRSDTFTLDSGSGSHSITFSYFLSSFTSNVSDEITVDLVNSANTSDRANLLTDTVASGVTQAAVWTEITNAIDSSFNGKTVYLEFTAQDGGGDDTVEAGIDDITVTYNDTWTPSATGAKEDGEVEDYQITITETDYGDAPDTGTGTGVGNYQTTEDDDGASHIIVSGLSIGSTAGDADDGTLQNTTADADDTDDSPNDEDGVTIATNPRIVDSSYSLDVDVTNTIGSDAVLVGWIDFDQSGTFDSDEAVTTTFSSNGGTLQTQTLTWNSIPGDILPGTTYARFRLSNDTTTLTTSYSNGLLSSGEVEDYQITIDAADYGDAPDTTSGTSTGDYSTTSSDGGAAHGIDNNLRLGANLDGDSGTLQNNDADADDTDGTPDDEDGVTSTLTDIATGDTSYSITLDVFNDTGNTAKLIGWIDFDRSGTFDSDEAVIRTINSSASTSSETLTWDNNGNGFTSSDISEGITYARFRLSTDTTTLTTNYSTGALTDGEVEDYQLTIVGVDYGDAPDDGVSGNGAGDYQTLEVNTGASHIIIDDLYLGGSVDADNGTLTDNDAVADDNYNTDDEDGVTFPNTLSKSDTSYSVDLVVTNETGSDAKLVGWIDFDQNGSFDSDEAVTQTISHAIGGQNTTLNWTSLPGIVGGTTYARFRLTADANLDLGNIQNSDSVGEFDSGEVEDYQIQVQGGIDYGDAPDTGSGTGTGNYQTLSSDTGASHTIVSNLYLGDLVDEDDGSLQNTTATADDNDLSNDEDGVNFLATLEEDDTSYSVTVDLTNDTGNDAKLVGWIDFNQNGNFEASEAATATISSSSTEQTATLTWNSISPTAGATYARFRLSTDNNLDSSYATDSLTDGEVEDYHLCVVSSGKRGSDGADTIVADASGSVIAGYKGQDTLTGGAGVDSFCYGETSDGVDIINGFTVGSGGDQIILTQILRDEVGYTGSDPIADDYVELVDYGTTGTMVQIDFDGTGSLLPKDIALVVDTGGADINETTLGANNLVF